jgi:hypothetical protein
MVRFWQASSGTLAFGSSRLMPAITAGRQSCARRCPHCGQLHRECAFAFPLRGLLAPSWPRRAQTVYVVSSWYPSRRRTRRGQRSRQRPARLLSVSGIRAFIVPNSTTWAGRSAWPWIFSQCSRASLRRAAAIASRVRRSRSTARTTGDRRRVAETLLRLGRQGHKRPRAGRGW